ncbi:RING-type E3 ubiquitin transferase [Salvia divinorum]|uniref:RING-type E3 ubiquitin transferase n=1 Tax=Salvia divinorum TaxID=28513 RepID=A0ABD1G4Y3_SALDI
MNPIPEPISREMSGGETLVSADERETISAAGDGDSEEASTSDERERKLMESPPSDDVCPICFGNFVVPCRAPCGHWYCGSCILQYWNFSAALQPCKCPMCSQRITKLIPEASLYQRRQSEISKVLRSVGDYNRLFMGGISGFVLKFLAFPLYIKRTFREMLNPDRPGVYLHEMRIIAMFIGLLYSFVPFDFLRIGRGNIIDLFDYSAFALSFILYLVGLYLRWKRERNIRELVDMPEGRD